MPRLAALITAPFRALGRLFGGGSAASAPGAEAAADPVAAAAAAPAPTPVAAPVTEDGVFVDLDRGRSIPYRLWHPAGVTGPAPVVVFSHGLGGSRAGAPYLGRALAEAGYWALFLQHKGSDAELTRGLSGPDLAETLRDSLSDPQNMLDRYADLPVALDELERLNADPGPLQGRFDLTAIGMAGHSYGARGVLAAAGQSLAAMGGAFGPAFKDSRIAAGLALSPTGGRGLGEDEILPPDHYAAIDVPILHVTGTEDRPPLVEDSFDPYIRTLPFQHIPAGDQYLLVFEGARHDDFSGTLRGEAPAPETRYTVTVAEVACLFFDAYLKGSETAWYNLRNKLSEHLEPGDYYEFR